MKLKVQKISNRAVMPKFAHRGDACFDISVIIDEQNVPMCVEDGEFSRIRSTSYSDTALSSVELHPGESMVFHTGLKFETDNGYNMKVYVRSSIGIKKNLILSNTTGVIDTATYRGELLIGLTNIGSDIVIVKDLDRVAQAEIVRTLDVEIEEVDSLSDTERGNGGIGSTGEK